MERPDYAPAAAAALANQPSSGAVIRGDLLRIVLGGGIKLVVLSFGVLSSWLLGTVLSTLSQLFSRRARHAPAKLDADS